MAGYTVTSVTTSTTNNVYVLGESGQDLAIVGKIENIAPGWRAKEVFRALSEDELEHTFSLAAPGKDFEVYTRARLKRVK